MPFPDLSDVLYTEYPGQAPQVVEDQVTYPLTTATLSVPVIFEERTDLYWARSRVLQEWDSAVLVPQPTLYRLVAVTMRL